MQPNDKLKGKIVLVVDKDNDNLQVAFIALSHFNALIMTAETVSNALEIIAKTPPHLIMTELKQEGMNGWDFIAKLKSDSITATIPLVALTDFPAHIEKKRALAAGCIAYIHKPITLQHIADTLLPALTE